MYRFKRILTVYLILLSIYFACWPRLTYAESAPDTRKIPRAITMHGETRIDPYAWLREREKPEVLQYLQAENRYTEQKMKHTEKLQGELYREMVGRMQERDTSLPERIDDFYYYARAEKGKEHPIYCRKKGSLEAPEEVLLDANPLAEGHSSFHLGAVKVSPNHRWLAFAVDTGGAEKYTIRIKDLKNGRLHKEAISNVSPNLEWGRDEQTLYYVQLDSTQRPCKLYRHRLGEDHRKDRPVYHEKDQAFFMNIRKSASRQYLFLELHSKNTSEIRYLNMDNFAGEFRVLQPRKPSVQYQAEHGGEFFYLSTNEGAENFKLIAIPSTKNSQQNRREILPHRKDAIIEDFRVFKNKLVVVERVKGLQKIRIINMSGGHIRYIEFPEPVYQVSLSDYQDFQRDTLRFVYSSLITQQQVYDYDLRTATRQLKKELVIHDYDRQQYESQRIFAQAPDGTKIPISLVYKKGMILDGSHPMLLTAYGSYGYSYPVHFTANRLSLLDRGFICAFAHVRGGQEMGRQWYEQGKLLNKKNTFKDFIVCAEYLIQENYTNRSKLAILGGSAGGLLMGAVTNMRSDLFQVVVAQVPFVDVLNTMSDPTLPLTVTEYDEWGDPREKAYYDYIKDYSPYENVKARNYPHMLVTAGYHDPRVSYWEPAKWVARLRDVKQDDNLLLLKTDMGRGHFGASGRYDQLKETSFVYAFILNGLGMTGS
ncbi:MAG: S9 family peptidase [Bacillota bacterium]|nr:S9 family peptidase [Bacillota bacterium]